MFTCIKTAWNRVRNMFATVLTTITTIWRLGFNPGLHIVVTVAEHACDQVLKRVLKPSTHRLQIFLVKYEYLRSLQLCEEQSTGGKFKKRVCKHVLAILTTYMETRLYTSATIGDCKTKNVKVQLHDAIYRLRFCSNSLIHILSLSSSHSDVALIQKNRGDKSHRVIVALGYDYTVRFISPILL